MKSLASPILLVVGFALFISGASMNPARSLAPALISNVLGDLWLYLSATFVGSTIIGFVYKKKFSK